MAHNSTRFLDTARNLGMQLVRDAIWDGNRCTWIGGWYDSIDGKFAFTTRSFGSDLYSGTAGVAFFLSALYTIDKDELMLKTIEGAVNHALSLKGAAPKSGFYSGITGVAYSLMVSGIRTGRTDWVDAGLDILRDLEPKAAYTFENDIISGIAGNLPVFLYAYAHTGDASFLDKAVTLGNTLIDTAEKSVIGWSWKTIPNMPSLLGLSHGCAGISGSLLELYAATKDEKYKAAALEGIKYEQTFFSPELANWPDFRNGHPPAKKDYTHSMAWCTGAPGVAISRLRCSELIKDETLGFHAEMALRTTYAQVMQELSAVQDMSNYSLCHGIAGNSDILLESDNELYKNAAAAVGLSGIEKYGTSRLPWPSGVISKQKTPGLMMGIAGTGYFYLRLYNQKAFETILLPPKYNG